MDVSKHEGRNECGACADCCCSVCMACGGDRIEEAFFRDDSLEFEEFESILLAVSLLSPLFASRLSVLLLKLGHRYCSKHVVVFTIKSQGVQSHVQLHFFRDPQFKHTLCWMDSWSLPLKLPLSTNSLYTLLNCGALLHHDLAYLVIVILNDWVQGIISVPFSATNAVCWIGEK